MIRTRGRRPLTCHHEAGHAVARWWLGFDTDRATVLTIEEVLDGVSLFDRRDREVPNVEGMVIGYDIHFPLGREGVAAMPEAERSWMAKRTEIRAEMALVELAAGIFAEARYRRQSVLSCVFAGGAGDDEGAQAIAGTWFDDEAACAAARGRADKIASALVRSPKGWAAVSAVARLLRSEGGIDGEMIDAECSAAYGAPLAYDRWAEAWPPTPAQIRAGFLPPPRRKAA